MKSEVRAKKTSGKKDVGNEQQDKIGGKGDFRQKIRRGRARLLATYYGNPARDLKIVCITGSLGKVTVARYVHEILTATGQHSAVLASEEVIKTGVLQKFLSDAWKARANVAVVTAPASSLEEEVFYGLPIAVAALTNFIPTGLKDMEVKEYMAAKETLFKMAPEVVVLNGDDKHYVDFEKFRGMKDTVVYGHGYGVDVRIDNSKLYKMGAEANLIVGNKSFTTATFLKGESVVSYMACATAIGVALKVAPVAISEGIGNFEE